MGLLRLDIRSGSLTILPSHKAWLPCDEMKHDQSTQKNWWFQQLTVFQQLIISTRPAPARNLLQCLALLSVTLGWRGFLCPLPDSSDPAPAPSEPCGWIRLGLIASAADVLVFVDTGRRQWTTTGFGWCLPLAYWPQLALFRLHWRVMRLAGCASTSANGANVGRQAVSC